MATQKTDTLSHDNEEITEDTKRKEQCLLKTKSSCLWKEPIPQKMAKLNENESSFAFNAIYQSEEIKSVVMAAWQAKLGNNLKDKHGIEVLTDPFQICLLPNLLQNATDCQALVNEMIERLEWSRKRLDLYEFCMAKIDDECKLLNNFRRLMESQVLPWVEKVTNQKFEDLSISCSMYTAGDHLLVHDDLLENREIAFVYYLSPWEGAEEWKESFGGCLEVFKADDKGFPRFPVSRKIPPKNNQLVFFKVDNKSFHQVGEITTFDYPRLSINGWFNGPKKSHGSTSSLSESHAPSLDLEFRGPLHFNNVMACDFINGEYLKATTCRQIQERFENTSEISLGDFLKVDIFESIQQQLLTDSNLKWRTKHPANLHYYEVLELSSATGAVEALVNLLGSEDMFKLLHAYTELDLAENTGSTFSLEVQRWSPGNYTIMGDGSLLPTNSLDLYYYLNVTDNAGIVTYLCPEDDPSEEDESVPLAISPVDNSMNMVYRLEGTTKFVKYVTKNCKQPKGPTFLISCIYQE